MSLSSLNCVAQTCSLQQRMRHGMESVAIPLVSEEKTPWGGLPSPPWLFFLPRTCGASQRDASAPVFSESACTA
jgi:hypothetical protein